MRTSFSVWCLCVVLGCCFVQSSALVRRSTTHHALREVKPLSYLTEETVNSSQEWFIQQLDHFNPNDDTEWKQRYWVNVDFYRQGAPVFLYIGGEGKESGFSEDLSKPWEKNAKDLHALMFKLEHRFYGKSQPTGGNMTVDDLKFLSSSQALADLANFIVSMNRLYKLPAGTRWVAVGCSYSGNLAAWLRYKYPHLVYAAVASSAPINVKVLFPEYFQAVGESLVKFYGTKGRMCLQVFKQAINEVKGLLETPGGLNSTIDKFGWRFKERYKIDWNDPLIEDKLKDVYSDIIYRLLLSGARVVQHNQYSELWQTWPITKFCDTLTNEGLGPSIMFRFEISYNFLNYIFPEDDNESNRLWNYQVCTEFPYFGTPERLGINIGDYAGETYRFNDCTKRYSEKFTEEFVRRRVDRTNTMYGGLELDATRIIYTQGTLDPWFPLGMNQTRNPLSPVIVIEGASHCSDMYSPSDHDSAALIAARANVSHILVGWLGPAPGDSSNLIAQT